MEELVDIREEIIKALVEYSIEGKTPCVIDIIRKTSFSRVTVNKYLKKLEETGLLKLRKAKGRLLVDFKFGDVLRAIVKYHEKGIMPYVSAVARDAGLSKYVAWCKIDVLRKHDIIETHKVGRFVFVKLKWWNRKLEYKGVVVEDDRIVVDRVRNRVPKHLKKIVEAMNNGVPVHE